MPQLITMSGKSRLDYLVSSESERQNMFGGWCQKLSAVFCALLGIAVLLISFLILRDERLQIQNYVDSQSTYYYKTFPAVLLGCSAATVAGSIIQIIGSLMLLFEDVTLSTWKWLKFTVLMISSASVLLLLNERSLYEDFQAFKVYFVVVSINTIYCTLLLTCDACCLRNRRNGFKPL